MELDQFRKDLIETVKAIAASESTYTESAFIEHTARLLADAEEVADFEPCYFRGTGSRNRAIRVDGYCEDDIDGTLSLVLADFRGSDEVPSLTATEANALFSRLKTFFEDSISGRLHSSIEESTPGYALSSLIHSRGDSISKLSLILVTDTLLSSRIKDLPAERIAGIHAEFHVWDIARFHRVHVSKLGREEIEVDFTEFHSEGLPCLVAHIDSDQYRSFLCVLPGHVLADIYERYGSRLLEQNVRSFLTVRGGVNKGIRNTILNEPGMFFAYNNGITTTAVDVTTSEDAAGRLRITGAKHLQIVNGGQTTASLALARKKDKAKLDNIFVQMKLSVIEPERAPKIIPNISRCANSQNKVSDADFFANHHFHWRMEEISRRIWAPAIGGAQHETKWFYERARGQYLNEQTLLTLSERQRFLRQHPRDQVMTKTDIAKYDNSWRLLPNKVSLGAQKNFREFADFIGKEWEKNNAVFNEEFFRRLIAKAIIFRQTERIVSRQDWYQGGWRAQTVTYTIAKLSYLINQAGRGRTADFRAIWNRQGLTPEMEAQLKSTARVVYQVLSNPDSGFQNIGEWCKKEACWKRVQDIDISLSKGMFAELIMPEEEKSILSEARSQQKVDNRITAQTVVINLGTAYWQGLSEWARSNSVVTAEDNKLLRLASSIPKKIPNSRQSEFLLILKERFENDGFPR
jgi:hypothetical protein